jgi:hypothetical protein
MALGLFALGGASNLAAKSTAGEKAAWTANPAVVYQQKGAYPGTLTVRLYSNNCQYDEHGDVKPASALKATDNYAITVTGAGISVLKLDVGDCSLTAALKIELATPGYKQLNVTKNPDGKRDLDAGFAPIDFMDALAGPTPSTPEVDVLWEVLTDHLCKDSFGNHMPHDLYCVEVKIGNNSAHSLQLAGVGFFRPIPNCNNPGKQSPFPCNQDPDDPHAGISTPNVSYATVRASAQAGTTTSLRNILYNGTQAIGLLMASFTPYFTNTVNRARWSTGAAIVGTSLSQAMNLVAPDLTVREMNNLDDQAFRDGKLIPNNTQVRLLVFIQKQSLAEAIGEIVPRVQQANQVPCQTPKQAGYKAVPGDSSQCYPGWEDSLKQCLKKLDCNPVIVKMALGKMIIVGDTIDYIQRVVVDSSVTSQEVGVPKSQETNQKTMTVKDATVNIGESHTFTAAVDGTQVAAGKVTWKSVDESVAKINEETGAVTALKAGSVKIIATPTESGVSAGTAILTVRAPAN